MDGWMDTRAGLGVLGECFATELYSNSILAYLFETGSC